ncbi:protein unc-13 homolog 4B-like isoform X2 [Chironomus tepperi]
MTPEPTETRLLRVNKFKSEVYEEMVLLISQDERNLAERSYKFKHLQDAFRMSEEKHQEILEKVADQLSQNKAPVNQDKASTSESKFYHLPEKINIENIEIHCALLQIFLQYDLKYLNVQRYHWSGEFCNMVQELLSLHVEARELNETHILYAKWIAYTEIHDIYPLNINTFMNLLDSLLLEELQQPRLRDVDWINSFLSLVSFGHSENAASGIMENDAANIGKRQLKYIDDEIARVFWKSTENLVEVLSKFIINLHFEDIDAERVKNLDILKDIWKIFDKIDSICVPGDEQPINFRECVKESLSKGVTVHLARNANQNLLKQGNRNDLRIDELVRLIKLAQDHLAQFPLEFSNIFEEYLGEKFPEYMYRIYDSELTVIIKPIVLNICDTKDGNIDNFASSREIVAPKLFDLYRELKKFADYGVEKYIKCDYEMSDYYSWFQANVLKYIKPSVFNVLPRLERAVETDTLRPDKEENKYSSSAMDLLELLDFAKEFWKCIEKARFDEDYTKFIVGDIFRFTTKYFQMFVIRVENSLNVNNFEELTSRLSVVYANYNHIKDKMIQYKIELTKESEFDASNVQNIIKYTIEYMETMINQLIITVTQKYYSSIREKIIIDAKVNDNSENNDDNKEVSSESVEYVKKVLKIFSESESRDYEMFKSELWNNIHEITFNMVKYANHQPMFYSRLRVVFSKLKEVFYCTDVPSEIVEKTKRLDDYLECYEYSISRLIHEYYKERFDAQQCLNQDITKRLTIKSFFNDCVLTIKIIDTNELFKLNKKYEPIMMIKIIPEKYFPNHQNFKLKLLQNTFKPIRIELTQEQRHMKDAIIYFRIEKKRFAFTKSLFGEAFLSFENIPINDFRKSTENENINLMLNKITKDGLKSLEPIRKESEKGNKEAKRFLDSIKSQM